MPLKNDSNISGKIDSFLQTGEGDVRSSETIHHVRRCGELFVEIREKTKSLAYTKPIGEMPETFRELVSDLINQGYRTYHVPAEYLKG